MAENTETAVMVAELPPFCKTKEILGKPVTIVDADQWEGNYGLEAKYTVVLEDGTLRAFTFTWSDWRAKTLERVINRLDGGEQGILVTLIQKEPRDGREGALLWDPLETERISDFKLNLRERRAAEQAAREEAAREKVGAAPKEEEIDPDDIPF